jgi:type VI secretion system protein ImpM
VLLPGVLPAPFGDQAWAGVLMPSVDRVGRYFPFTVVQSLGDELALPPLAAVWPWLDRLDELAADALHEDWNVERVEAELALLPPPSAAAPSASERSSADRPQPPGTVRSVVLPPSLDAAGWIALEAQRLWIAHERGASVWCAQAEGDAVPRLYRVRGLPDAAALAGLLGSESAGAAAAASAAIKPMGAEADATIAAGHDPEATAPPGGAGSAPGAR